VAAPSAGEEVLAGKAPRDDERDVRGPLVGRPVRPRHSATSTAITAMMVTANVTSAATVVR
jgi:hypothetical protein